MDSISISSHLKADTRTRVTSYPDHSRPFVSLRIEGDAIEIALLCSHGSADALRTLATAASEAAAALDALTVDGMEEAGRE
ncbi:hypothetical protein [Streptomyces sp. NPDC093105]|uniref:hypothetical protein n=1 Tax=Streptomyces sp. NPDC093105 TaxID=3366029 RepID=UPI003811409B